MSSKETLDLIRKPSGAFYRDTALLLSILDKLQIVKKRLNKEIRQSEVLHLPSEKS